MLSMFGSRKIKRLEIQLAVRPIGIRMVCVTSWMSAGLLTRPWVRVVESAASLVGKRARYWKQVVVYRRRKTSYVIALNQDGRRSSIAGIVTGPCRIDHDDRHPREPPWSRWIAAMLSPTSETALSTASLAQPEHYSREARPVSVKGYQVRSRGVASFRCSSLQSSNPTGSRSAIYYRTKRSCGSHASLYRRSEYV
jgi:hypothetical protein